MIEDRRWTTAAAYAYALAVAAILSYFLLDLPIQLSDSFGNMLKLQGVSLGELVYSEFWQRAYLRPFLWAELKVVFDLADGNYSTWYRWVHVFQVAAVVLLFVRLVRPRAAVDAVSLPLGLAALIGIHTFTGTVIEAFPINTFLTIVLCALLAAHLALSPYRWWNDVLAALLLVVAGLTVESGLLVGVIFLAAALVRSPGISRAGAAVQLALLAGYLVVRFTVLDVGSPTLAERASGFGSERLEPAELQQRFGDNPLPFYAYNVLSSLLSVVASEPRGGVWRVGFGATAAIEPWIIVNWTSSILGSALIAMFAWQRRAAWRARELTHDDRIVVLFGAVLIANSVISYPYTKDVVMSPAGAFFALALAVAARHAVADVDWRGWRTPAALALALVLSAGWSIRYIGVHANLRSAAYQVRDEWAVADTWIARQFGEAVLHDPAAQRLKQTLQADAVHLRPALRPRLPHSRWTRLVEVQ
jgi:hypothetical protein